MNNTELFAFLPHMVEDERGHSFRITFLEKSLFCIIFILTGIWGTLMKIFLYYNLCQEKLSKRPINSLILADLVIDHILKIAAIIIELIVVSWFFEVKMVGTIQRTK